VTTKRVLTVLWVLALVALVVWLGPPGGRFIAVGLAAAAWRYFLWEDRA